MPWYSVDRWHEWCVGPGGAVVPMVPSAPRLQLHLPLPLPGPGAAGLQWPPRHRGQGRWQRAGAGEGHECGTGPRGWGERGGHRGMGDSPGWAVPSQGAPCHAKRGCAMPCYSTLCHAMICGAVPCCAVPSYAMPCRAVPCHATSRRVRSSPGTAGCAARVKSPPETRPHRPRPASGQRPRRGGAGLSRAGQRESGRERSRAGTARGTGPSRDRNRDRDAGPNRAGA